MVLKLVCQLRLSSLMLGRIKYNYQTGRGQNQAVFCQDYTQVFIGPTPP